MYSASNDLRGFSTGVLGEETFGSVDAGVWDVKRCRLVDVMDAKREG